MHSYAVHTDSVWALAASPSFTHVYSGGRDMSVSRVLYVIFISSDSDTCLANVCYHFLQLYLTDLATRESLLLCTEEYPILKAALHDDSIWIATTDSSVHRWPAEVCNPQKIFEKGGSFLAGNLSFSRARVSLEGSALVRSAFCLFLQ